MLFGFIFTMIHGMPASFMNSIPQCNRPASPANGSPTRAKVFPGHHTSIFPNMDINLFRETLLSRCLIGLDGAWAYYMRMLGFKEE